MKNVLVSFLVLGSLASACSSDQGGESAPGTGRLRIEVACAADSDCPASFECERETEHGVTTSFCESHDEANPDGSGAQCPDGFELEVEHGTSFCKPHGGDHDNSGHGSGGADNSGPGGGDDDSSGPGGGDDSGHAGGSDDGPGHDAGDDHGHGGEGGDDSGHSGRG